MAKLNWVRTREQKRAQKYGIEVDYSVGADPNKIPKYSNPRNNPIMKKILGAIEEDNEDG